MRWGEEFRHFINMWILNMLIYKICYNHTCFHYFIIKANREKLQNLSWLGFWLNWSPVLSLTQGTAALRVLVGHPASVSCSTFTVLHSQCASWPINHSVPFRPISNVLIRAPRGDVSCARCTTYGHFLCTLYHVLAFSVHAVPRIGISCARCWRHLSSVPFSSRADVSCTHCWLRLSPLAAAMAEC